MTHSYLTSGERLAEQPGRITPRSGLVGFFVAAYALSWMAWIPAILMDAGRLDLPVPLLVLVVLGGLGPMVAAILTSWAMSGTDGVRRLFGQLKRWRVGRRWYAMTLVGVPAIGLATIVVHAALGGMLAVEAIPGILLVSPVLFVFVALIGGGLDEEMGWRGFALPQLQSTLGPLTGNIVLGVLWTCWHIPLFFITEGGAFTQSPFAVYLLSTVGLSFVLAWLYNSTGGSLLIAVFAHAAHNITTSATENLVFRPFGGTLSVVEYEIVDAFIWILVAIILIALTRGTLNAHHVHHP